MGLKAVSGGISGSGTQEALRILGAQPALSLVGQRCGQNGWFSPAGGSTPYFTNHQRVLFPYGADAVQLVYSNWYITSNGNGEAINPPSMFHASGVTYSGGTGYAVGDIDTFAVTNTTAIAAVKVMITAVSGGVPTQVQVIDGGLYNTPLGSGVSPASTSGSGTGATATFTWTAGCMGMHIGIEPVWNTYVAPNGGGAGAVELVSKGGLQANNISAWNLLVPMNGYLVSDIIPVDIAIGAYAGIRLSGGYNTPATGRLPLSSTFSSAPSANYEATPTASTFTDFSASGTIGTTRTANLTQPTLILGIPKKIGPTVIGIGDSRMAGVSAGTGNKFGYDAMDNDGNMAWLEKAMSSFNAKCVFPWANFAVGSDLLQQFLVGNQSKRYGRLSAIAMARPTAVCMNLNVNDLSSGTSLAQVKTWEAQVVGELRGLGVKYVFTATTDPETTSTDSWATTANQTPSTGNANMTARNQALRAGTWVNYDFFVDNSPNVESSLNSGLWVVNGTANYATGDGVHPSPAIYNAMALTAASVLAANISA